MLNTLTAVRVNREIRVGRNKPVILTGEDAQGSTVEVVAKLAHRCERGCNALVVEAISAMFARDLGLPVPEPFIVHIDPDLAAELFKHLPGRQEGHPDIPAFGSRLLPPGYGTYLPRKPLADSLVPSAAEVLAFDVIIQNSDRLPTNPNCLTDGQRLAIIDHELAFPSIIIGWTPPWEPDSLRFLEGNMGHLFFAELKGRPIDLTRLVGAIEAITDDRLIEYREALPENWIGNDPQDSRIIESIRDMRGHITDIAIRIKEALR